MSRNRVWRRGYTVPHKRWCVSDRLRSRRRDIDFWRGLFHDCTAAQQHMALCQATEFFDEARYFSLTISIYDRSEGDV